MRTLLCEKLGCDLPIFAFSHCRDVVVEVCKAGGFGVLGAALFSPEQLEAEMRWIDRHIEGRPYGVDVLFTSNYDRQAEAAHEDPAKLIPQAHRDFLNKFLQDEGVAQLPDGERERVVREIVGGRGQMTPEGSRRLLAVALAHSQVRLVVSALGSPPPDVFSELRRRDIVVGAVCGKVDHALRHMAAGVDVIVAQGTEAAGHTGDVATMVLVPQVVQACNGKTAVLAAGGIAHGSQIAAALAMGAEGVWCGSVWLGTRESELDPTEKEVLFASRAEDAVRRKCRTGKPVRMTKSPMSEIWEQPDSPGYLPTPLQGILFAEGHVRVVRAQRKDLYSCSVGQVVGLMTSETSVRDVIYRMQMEYLESIDRLNALTAGVA